MLFLKKIAGPVLLVVVVGWFNLLVLRFVLICWPTSSFYMFLWSGVFFLLDVLV